MNRYEIALMVAGLIGCIVAIVHGMIMQKLMVGPILTNPVHSPPVRRLIPLLLQFSTFCWLLGGLALIAAPWLPNTSVVLTAAVFVGAFYAFGMIGNFWATSGRHFGWILLAIALGFLIYGAIGTMNSQNVA